DEFINALKLDPCCKVSGGFESLNYENKETALKGLQQNIPESFENILELISLVYYSNDKVLDRINWKRKTLQPNGWEVEKFDPEVLETTKLRKPFWKEV
ncbi:MAG: hypothetical protein QF908_02755, partial [Dehalococcoidia bacterium]|nr:hypothetical protein [Dehalococcoidia bacterium]